MTLRISTDVGGTFTDIVVADNDGKVNIFKSSTTPEDPIKGIINGLNLASDFYGVSTDDLLERCDFLCHGSTISTNALIEGKTAKVGLLCTEGHKDVLLFRQSSKDNPFQWYLDYPEPYVPRHLTFSVKERMNPDGEVITPLEETNVREAINELKKLNVEVIAVSLLWSFMNPIHEQRIAEIIEEEWPEVSYSLSHIVNPRILEYKRTVSTSIDASLKPLINNYVSTFKEKMAEIGYQKEPYLLTSSGGVTLPNELMEHPIYSLDSGPALAPISGKFYTKKEFNSENVLTCDMGGTSFDISRVTNGDVTVTNDFELGNERLSIPKVDVKTIGSGGGSIAWVDEGGLLRIGPEGAGSLPGPACYMRGGTKATITDAALILGYLDGDNFLGGRMKLNKKAAEDAIMSNVGEPLNMNLMEAAFAIWNTATAKMADAIRDMTVWEGIDPKDYVLVAGGGAVGIHIIPMVSQLGINKVIIPKTSPTLSAFGGVIADLVKEFEQSFFTTTANFDYNAANRCLEDLREEAESFLNNAGIPKENQSLEFSLEARYPFQEQELPFPLRKSYFEGNQDIKIIEEDFHHTHEDVRGSMDPSQHIECIVWKVTARGIIPEINLEESDLKNDIPTEARKTQREVYFKELGTITTEIYDGNKLIVGNTIKGPAVIEESNTNLVVFPDSYATVSKYGNYLIKTV